jgi:hypothetical protein
MRQAATSLLAIALVLTATLAVGGPAAADADEGPPDSATTHIGLRGDWVIQVADPDGTIVAVHEFQNALLPVGESMIADIVAGNRSAGGFAVALHHATGSSGASPCAPSDSCFISEPRHPILAGPTSSKNLTKIVTTAPVAIVLQGSIQVPGSGEFTGVNTRLSACRGLTGGPGPSTVPPASCQAGSVSIMANPFTAATLPVPIAVEAGQTVLATVTLTFGTAPAAAGASR